jgi:hypothetical protein
LIDGRLFTRDFLLQGIRETQTWSAVDDDALAVWSRSAKAMLNALAARKNANEAETEADLVYPLLERLGWTDRDAQPSLSEKRRLDVPDALLYADASAKALAAPLEPANRFQHGLCIVEAKRWARVLDRETKGPSGRGRHPIVADAAILAPRGRSHAGQIAVGHAHQRATLAALLSRRHRHLGKLSVNRPRHGLGRSSLFKT